MQKSDGWQRLTDDSRDQSHPRGDTVEGHGEVGGSNVADRVLDEGTRTPASETRSGSGRAIGAANRSPGPDGAIRRTPMELRNQAPMAAQAAVGVLVSDEVDRGWGMGRVEKTPRPPGPSSRHPFPIPYPHHPSPSLP